MVRNKTQIALSDLTPDADEQDLALAAVEEEMSTENLEGIIE